jgi:hypothetical protein
MTNSGYQQNVTYIDELPELEELEGQGPRQFQPSTINQTRESKYQMLPRQEAKKFQKYIRGGYTPPSEAGMNSNGLFQQQFLQEQEQEQEQEKNGLKLITMPDNSPSCLDVCEHIQNCPLCSKFYNNDKTVYVIAIVVLAIICILLLKRVLDV